MTGFSNRVEWSRQRLSFRCPEARVEVSLELKDPRTGQQQWWEFDRCGLQECGYCGYFKARDTAFALSDTRPQRTVVFTWADPDPAVTTLAVNEAVRSYRRRTGRSFHHAWTVEPNTSGTGCHVQMIQRGASIDIPILKDATKNQGFGAPRVRMAGRAVQYGNYLLKTALAARKAKTYREAEAILAAFFRLNGSQFVHTSRGYWRDARGRPVADVEEARRLARALHLPNRDHPPFYGGGPSMGQLMKHRTWGK